MVNLESQWDIFLFWTRQFLLGGGFCRGEGEWGRGVPFNFTEIIESKDNVCQITNLIVNES